MNSSDRREKRIKEMQNCFLIFNLVCACVLSIALFMYFYDFFNLNIDGDVQNRISGFKLSFILIDDSLKDHSNILTLLNKKYGAKIIFASLTSCLAMFTIAGLIGLMIYRAVKRKPLLSRAVLIVLSAVLIQLIIQIMACNSLAGFVEQYYYSSCATCIVQSFSYMPIVIFFVFSACYFCLSYWLYIKYSITFTKQSN